MFCLGSVRWRLGDQAWHAIPLIRFGVELNSLSSRHQFLLRARAGLNENSKFMFLLIDRELHCSW